MKRVLVKSVYSAFDYVMEHYYPEGLEANSLYITMRSLELILKDYE